MWYWFLKSWEQEEEIKQLKNEKVTLQHNEEQASKSCKQHRLASKNHIRRLKRREKQIQRLKGISKEAREEVKELQEKYFKMCVPGSNNDFINLLDIIDKGLK